MRLELIVCCHGLFRSTAWLAALAALALPCLEAGAADQQPGPAYTQTVPDVEMEFKMVPVPGGTFTMGSSADEPGRASDEGPQFKVRIEPFWMGQCEVIWDDFQKFRSDYNNVPDKDVLDKAAEFQGDKATRRWADAVSLPTPLWEQDSAPILNGLGTEGGYPASDISQYAARQYTKWLSKKTGRFYRLPTEAEWEYAARAGTQSAWSFGDDPDQLDAYGWYFDNSAYEDPAKGHPDFGAGYRKVKQKKPNPWGLYDMYGNVSEWVLDAYAPDHYQRFTGRTVDWKEALCRSTNVFPRVVRGGNWNSEAEQCRSAARLASDKSWQNRDPQFPKSIWWYTDAFHIGFRVISPLKEPSAEEQLGYWEADTELEKFVLRSNDKILRAIIDRDAAAKP